MNGQCLAIVRAVYILEMGLNCRHLRASRRYSDGEIIIIFHLKTLVASSHAAVNPL